MSRRHVLKKLGMAGGAVLATGCTPIGILLHGYPPEFDSDAALVDRVLAALADAILPDAGTDPVLLARPFYDERMELYKYRNFLAADLCRRARRLCGTHEFELLPRDQRGRVIENGLAADSTTKKLYAGAIFAAQVAFYAGIYDDESGCAAIGFDGRFRPRPLAELTFSDADDFLSQHVGVAGNYA